MSTEERYDFAFWKGDGLMLCRMTDLDGMEEAIAEGKSLVKVVRNKTVDEAFALFHDFFNLGPYKPMGPDEGREQPDE